MFFKTSLFPYLDGWTDCHCHVLPGVDDGFRSIEDSLSALQLYEQMGVKHLWLTPHVMEDVPNTTSALRSRFAELKAAYQGPVLLSLASENMLDSLFEQRLAANDFLPIFDACHLLVETSYFTPPFGMDQLLERIRVLGYFPVLAHPERYLYMDLNRYKELHSNGIQFQLNLPSLVGMYGPEVKKRAFWLLKHGYYQYSGSDSHRIGMLENLSKGTLRKGAMKALELIEKAW